MGISHKHADFIKAKLDFICAAVGHEPYDQQNAITALLVKYIMLFICVGLPIIIGLGACSYLYVKHKKHLKQGVVV